MKTFSIITATLNSEKTVERCINSVLNQTYASYEHIIVDGGSTDKTLQLIEKYQSKKIMLIHGPDEGVYDAWNKGVEVISGDWVVFIGSDDFLLNTNVLEFVAQRITLDPQEPGFVSTRLIKGTVDQKTEIWRSSYGWDILHDLRDGPMRAFPPQPSLFHSKAIFDKGSRFDTSYRYAADAKLFWENIGVSNIQYLDVYSTYFSLGGLTNSNNNSFNRWMEKERLRRDLGMSIDLALYIKSFIMAFWRQYFNYK